MNSTPVISSSINDDEEEEEEWIISKSCKNIHKQIGTKLDEEELLDLIDTGSYNIHLSSSSSSYTTTTSIASSSTSPFSSNSRKRSLSMISDEGIGELRAIDDDYGNISSSSDGNLHFSKKSYKVKKFDKSFTSMKGRKLNKNNSIIRWTSGNQELDFLLQEIKSVKGQNENTFLWIDLESFKDICEIGKGGFATVYRAIWIRSSNNNNNNDNDKYNNNGNSDNLVVALKRFHKSEKISSKFLNKLKIYIKASIQTSSLLPIYGITKDPITKDYMIVMKYIPHGNLYQFMRTRPKTMTLKEKQQLIYEIIRSLHKLHFANLIQQNLHGGNILINYHEHDIVLDDGCNKEMENNRIKVYISDMGLSFPADQIIQLSYGTYGILPYLAPEILNGGNHYGSGLHHYVSHQQKLDDDYNNVYTKSADIYSLGIILWEVFLEQLAFYNRSHDPKLQLEISDSLRPNVVVNGIPKYFIDLMKKCWDNCSKNRPTIEEILAMLDRWNLLLDDTSTLTSSLEVFKSDNSNYDNLLLLNQKPTIKDDGDDDKQIEDELCDAISQISTVGEIHPEAIYTNRFIHYNYVYTNRDDSSGEGW